MWRRGVVTIGDGMGELGVGAVAVIASTCAAMIAGCAGVD